MLKFVSSALGDKTENDRLYVLCKRNTLKLIRTCDGETDAAGLIR